MPERLIVSLIGMSNIGKSHWSKLLEVEGFKRYCCDDLIAMILDPKLKSQGYKRGIEEVAEWMGQPYAPQYPRTSQEYLEAEVRAVSEVLDEVEESKSDQNIVIDTTGSVIYLPRNCLARLARLAHVVYLETPGEVVEEMQRKFREIPKPVIWGESFRIAPGLTDTQALGNCYPELLAYRSERYAELAHVTLDYHDLRHRNYTGYNFISAIKPR